jgi:hypothetical protein
MKTKKIQLKAELKDFGQQKTISIFVGDAESQQLALLLLLLREKLVDTIEIMLDNFVVYLKLNDENRSICSLFNLTKKSFKGSISMNTLEYAIYFLLKYFRDEMAPVEHIDLDFEYDNDSIITLVIKVHAYNEISQEEMNKLLGL